MKNLKKITDADLQKTLKKTKEKFNSSRILIYLALLTGVGLIIGSPVAWAFGSAAIAKAFLVVGLAQSLTITAALVNGYKLFVKEEKLNAEIELRKKINSKEFKSEKSILKQVDISNSRYNDNGKDKTSSNEHHNDDDFTNSL